MPSLFLCPRSSTFGMKIIPGFNYNVLSSQLRQERGGHIMDRQRLEELDIMRGLAILIILFHHLPDYGFNFFDLRNFGIGLDLSFLNGLNTYFGLGLFIYVSGVLLQHNYRGLSGGGVSSFLKKGFSGYSRFITSRWRYS